jgi:hypothetical protein
MTTALEYSTRVVQEGGRRCKKSTINDLVHLTPLRIPLMNPPSLLDWSVLYTEATIVPLLHMAENKCLHLHSDIFLSQLLSADTNEDSDNEN